MSKAYRTSDFAYALPPELIAQTPAQERGWSRLLVVEPGKGAESPRFADRTFADFPGLVPPGAS